jgi:ribosomal protein S7
MEKTIYTNLLGCITKNGKKTKAKKILSSALLDVSTNLNIPISKIFVNLVQKSGSIVELKKVKLRKNVHFIPFPVKKKRRYFLVSKEIINHNDSKKKLPSSIKISDQIKSFIVKRGKNIDKKKNLINQVIANRSNVHYRW